MPPCRLRLFAIDEHDRTRERAVPIVAALAAKRSVEGGGPWILTYAATDPSQAFASCAEELDAIDPSWVEVLDFVAMPDGAAG